MSSRMEAPVSSPMAAMASSASVSTASGVTPSSIASRAARSDSSARLMASAWRAFVRISPAGASAGGEVLRHCLLERFEPRAFFCREHAYGIERCCQRVRMHGGGQVGFVEHCDAHGGSLRGGDDLVGRHHPAGAPRQTPQWQALRLPPRPAPGVRRWPPRDRMFRAVRRCRSGAEVRRRAKRARQSCRGSCRVRPSRWRAHSRAGR